MQKRFWIYILVIGLSFSAHWTSWAQSEEVQEDSFSSNNASSFGDLKFLTSSSGGANAGAQTAQLDQFTGAVTHSFSFPLPPARGSIKPQLTLKYNHRNKNPNSWVGYGWELDLGSIQRAASQGRVNYDNGTAFHFRLAGQNETLELVSSNISNAGDYDIVLNSGAQADLYRNKIEGSYNYYLHIHTPRSEGGQSADSGWIVIDKSGMRYEFGLDSNSQIHELCAISQPTCGLRVRQWYLSRVVDPNQNELLITYDSNHYLSELEYQDITVEFTIEQKRIFPIYRESLVTPTGHKLTGVSITSHGSLLQRYVLEYDESFKNGAAYLSHIKQYGPSASEDLPIKAFEYYADTMEWSSQSHDYQASINSSGLEHKGYLDNNLKLIDMNGDGLSDKVVAFENSNKIHVYYNNGNDFVYVNGKSEWTDPLYSELQSLDRTRHNGRLVSYKYQTRPELLQDGYLQWIFFQDINGDSLPDRFVRKVDSGDPNQYYFDVYLNEGSQWSVTAIHWNDAPMPEVLRISEKDFFLMDMNGDGLVDRVASSQSHPKSYSGNLGFNVYLNTGTEFQATPEFWYDPIYDIDYGLEGESQLYGEYGSGLRTVIKDFNGDGLPDRLYRHRLVSTTGQNGYEYGWFVFLNVNGESWGQITNNSGVLSVDHKNVLFVADTDVIEIDVELPWPLSSEDESIYHAIKLGGGLISPTYDLIDINGDGFLDAVQGQPDQGQFRIAFFNGRTSGDHYSSFSDVQIFSDPITDPSSDEWRSEGYISARGQFNRYSGTPVHAAIMDVNGDGFVDRISFDPKSDSVTNRVMQVYSLEMNAVQFSETQSIWDHPNVNQPACLLKSTRTIWNGHSSLQSVVEYIPSSWPTQWSSNFSGLPLNHRFLPFNLWLGHKVYQKDYSLSLSETGPEAARYPGMRWSRTDYFGGNFFIRNPSSTQERFTQFNGFHRVQIVIQKGVRETYDDMSTLTVYHQTIGDIDLVDPLDNADFEMSAYSHYALAGKPYYTLVQENGVSLSAETNRFIVNNADGDFECLDPSPCLPQIQNVTKVVREPSSTNTRTTQVSYEYDDWNNVTHKTHKDRNGNILLVYEYDYYDPSDFAATLHIRNLLSQQRKTDGSTQLKYKEFDYDSLGNPTQEKWEVQSGQYNTINRTFNSDGTLKTISDVDGVVKTLNYDADGLFPISESSTLPTGDILTKTYEYNRMLGKIQRTTDVYGVGSFTEYDEYGRVLSETMIDRSGSQHKVKWYDYEYSFQSINGFDDFFVLRTRTWSPLEDYADTSTLPSSVIYSSGGVLQSCALSERGNYRMLQSRVDNGGRTIINNHPVFVNQCDYESNIRATNARDVTYVDYHGRTLYIDTPGSDVGSPVSQIHYEYSITPLGYFKTVATNQDGRKVIKLFDDFERLRSLTDTTGHTLTYDYDSNGNMIRVTENGTALIEIEYDLLGRKTEMWDANFGTWRYHYDQYGRLEWQIDALDQKIIFEYDSFSRKTKKLFFRSDSSLEKYEEYLYDSGDTAHNVLPGEQFAVIEYDSSNSVVRKTRFGYESNLRKTSKITRDISGLGQFTQIYQYNSWGVLRSTTYPGNQTVSYKYARTGSVEQVCEGLSCDTSSEIYYLIDPYVDYNVYGSSLRETFGNGVVSHYEYYENSRRLKRKYIERNGVNYSDRQFEYDAYNNILDINDALSTSGSGGLKNVSYDRNNRLISYQPQDFSVSKTFSYAGNGNLTSHSHSFGSDIYQYTSSKPHAVTKIGDVSLTYDLNGNMLTDSERVMTYDVRNKLKTVTMSNGNQVAFEYDYTGSRVSKHVVGLNALGAKIDTKTYYLGDSIEIKDGKLIFHIYAKKKKVATRTVGDLDDILGGGGASAVYKNFQLESPAQKTGTTVLFALGFLLMFSMRPTQTRIPAFIRRRMSRVPTSFTDRISRLVCQAYLSIRAYRRAFIEMVYSLNHQVFKKSISFALIAFFVMQPFIIQNVYAASSDHEVNIEPSFFYYHGDHLGSSHIMTEGEDRAVHAGLTYSKGDLIQRIEYYPFGQEKFVLNPGLRIDPSYTGQHYDVNTGLYYYNARYYNPKLARFTQADTVLPSAKDYQSFNRYSYVRNNPLIYTDPSGHILKSIMGFSAQFSGAFMVGAGYAMLPTNPFAGVALIAAGSAMNGAMTGGWKGALISGLTLGYGPLVMNAMQGNWSAVGQGALSTAMSAVGGMGPAARLITTGVGLSLAAHTGGWRGFISYGVGSLGAYAGSAAVAKSSNKSDSNSAYTGTESDVSQVQTQVNSYTSSASQTVATEPVVTAKPQSVAESPSVSEIQVIVKNVPEEAPAAVQTVSDQGGAGSASSAAATPRNTASQLIQDGINDSLKAVAEYTEGNLQKIGKLPKDSKIIKSGSKVVHAVSAGKKLIEGYLEDGGKFGDNFNNAVVDALIDDVCPAIVEDIGSKAGAALGGAAAGATSFGLGTAGGILLGDAIGGFVGSRAGSYLCPMLNDVLVRP